MPLESCIGDHGASKSSRDPKTVDYSPRKRPEMSVNVVRASLHRNPPNVPETVDYSPRKRPEMLEITSFDDAARVVYQGSRGIEILPQKPKPQFVNYCTRECRFSEFKVVVRFLS